MKALTDLSSHQEHLAVAYLADFYFSVIFRCSPEAVCRLIFTTKGDVWSYGVLMWEIFSQGSRPHLVTECNQKELKEKLEAGVRLRRPEKCPEEFYKIMKEMCWKYEPNERPDFQLIAFKVDEISKNLAEKKESTE